MASNGGGVMAAQRVVATGSRTGQVLDWQHHGVGGILDIEDIRSEEDGRARASQLLRAARLVQRSANTPEFVEDGDHELLEMALWASQECLERAIALHNDRAAKAAA